MSTIMTKARPTWNSYQGVVTLAYQILIGFLLQIPFLYYFRELRALKTKDAQLFLLGYIPVAVMLVVISELFMTEYYWGNEKIRKHRDVWKIGVKASVWVSIVYALSLYLFAFYLLPKSETLQPYFPQNPLEEIMILSLTGHSILIFLAAFYLTTFEEKLKNRIRKFRAKR